MPPDLPRQTPLRNACALPRLTDTNRGTSAYSGALSAHAGMPPALLDIIGEPAHTAESGPARLKRCGCVGDGRGVDQRDNAVLRHRDALHLGDCDDAVQELCRLLGWEADLAALVEGNAPVAASL